MADFTAFLSKLLVAWPDDVDEYQFSDVITLKNGLDTIAFAQSYYMTDSMALDAADVRTITWPTTGATQTAMTKLIWARVIGSALLTHTGTDPNSAAPTMTYLRAHGTDKIPGIIFLYATGLSGSFTITGEADGTTVELYAGIV